MGRRGSDWKEGTVIGKEGDSDGRRGHRWGEGRMIGKKEQ